MAANPNQVGLEAVFENEDFQRGIEDYNKSVGDASKETQSAGDLMEGVWVGLAAVGAVVFTAIASSIGVMTAALYDSVDAALDAEYTLARVAFVVDNVSDRTGVTTDEVLALADSLEMVQPVDGEVVASAIAMGLTFDGVNEDNIQPLIQAAIDLSLFTGKDLPATMKTLSMAISDPDKAMRLFREANITLTDAEKENLDAMNELGDTAGITQFILEQLAKKGILGLGDALADTGRGKMEILKNSIGNLQEQLGTGFLDALSEVLDMLNEFARDPRVIEFFVEVGEAIGQFASEVIAKLPSIIDGLSALGDWFRENEAIIIGILAALGVALVVFGASFAAAAYTAIVGIAPILLVMGLVGAAVALLFTAWNENWGGIQELVGELWVVLEPIFNELMKWLEINIPIALQFLSDMWTNVFLPALETVFSWLANTFIPLWIQIIQWLQVNIPAAIQFLSGLWTGTLLPAIQAVWGWISANLIPLFMAINNLVSAVLGLALTALAGIWQNILLPALQAVGSFITANLLPIFTTLNGFVSNTLMPTLRPLADFLTNVLKAAFDGITAAIQTLTGWINTLAEAFNNVELPTALTPGSPTPFEIGLKGINDQLSKLYKTALPALTNELSILATVRDVPTGNASSMIGANAGSTSSSTYNYLFGAQFNVNNQNGLFDILYGLS